MKDSMNGLNLILEDVANDYCFDVRWDYSGRGMDGCTCFAIVGDFASVGLFIASVTEECVMEKNDAYSVDMWEGMSRDSMGLSSIIYFPRITKDN